jgi:hypothetical protein
VVRKARSGGASGSKQGKVKRETDRQREREREREVFHRENHIPTISV